MHTRLTITLAAPALNNICLDQTRGSAGALNINGSLASGGVVSLATAQRIDIESVGNLSGVTFTIVGTDPDGVALTEAIAGPNNNTVTTTGYFLTVTGVSVDGAVGTNVSLGVTDEAASRTLPMDRYRSVGTAFGVDLTGTINLSVQKLLSSPQADLSRYWIGITNLVGVEADSSAEVFGPMQGVRVVVNSYTSGASAVVDVLEG